MSKSDPEPANALYPGEYLLSCIIAGVVDDKESQAGNRE